MRSLKFLAAYKLQALGSLIFLLAGSAGSLVLPKIIQIIIDEGIPRQDLETILRGALGMLGIAVLRSLFAFFQGMLAVRTSQGIVFDLRNALYSHIQKLSFSYHDKTQTGQLLTRITSDVELIKQFISIGVIEFLHAVLLITGSIVLLFLTNWRLSAVIIPLFFLLTFIFRFFSRRGFPLFKTAQQKLALLNIRFQETVLGMRVVKAFAAEERERKNFAAANRDLKFINIKAGRIFAWGMPLMFSLANFGSLLLIWAGGLSMLDGSLSFGELIAFQNYLMMALFPVLMLGMIMMNLSAAAAGAERIFEILDTPSDIGQKPGAPELKPVKGRVVFDKVAFRYFKHTEPVLQDISFDTKPGQTIALVGATGSGKSTVINLIPRFYDVTAGRITIDGTDIRDVTLDSLRRQISVVLQETVLFGGTVRYNIAYGRKNARPEEIVRAAKTAEAHAFIQSLPRGYDTLIGERGVTLSGGQKQRIAIARALLVKPRILILDDSTSSVDYETESRIEKAMAKLRRGRLCFIIAQRISTVRSADTILVLDKGRLAASGTHAELLRDSPLYAEIYHSQLAETEGDDLCSA